jgi:hypothetical protein
MTIDAVIARFGARRNGKAWMAKCPAHEDDRASLSIASGAGGKVLFHCHAGCSYAAILSAAHLTAGDVSSTTSPAVSADAAHYDYRDEHGTLLFQVVRALPKRFHQRRPDGRGGWIANLDGVRRVPYRLADVQGRKTVFVVEGEKDVDRLWTLDLPATTNAGGAGKWRPEHAALLKAAGCQSVIVLPDNDPTGAAHGRDVARSCVDAGLEVKLVPLPNLPRKGDVSEPRDAHEGGAPDDRARRAAV